MATLLRDGLPARTPVAYRLTLIIHDLNRDNMLRWWAEHGTSVEPLPDGDPHVTVYPEGVLPWKTNAKQRAKIYGPRRWCRLVSIYRSGREVVETVTGDVFDKLDRLIRLGRVRRVGLTKYEEWADV